MAVHRQLSIETVPLLQCAAAVLMETYAFANNLADTEDILCATVREKAIGAMLALSIGLADREDGSKLDAMTSARDRATACIGLLLMIANSRSAMPLNTDDLRAKLADVVRQINVRRNMLTDGDQR